MEADDYRMEKQEMKINPKSCRRKSNMKEILCKRNRNQEKMNLDDYVAGVRKP